MAEVTTYFWHSCGAWYYVNDDGDPFAQEHGPFYDFEEAVTHWRVRSRRPNWKMEVLPVTPRHLVAPGFTVVHGGTTNWFERARLKAQTDEPVQPIAMIGKRRP